MQMTQRNKIILSAIAVIVLVGVYILFDRRSGGIEDGNNEPIATTTIDNTASSTTGNTKVTGGYTIEQVPIEEGQGVPQPIPNLDRPITISSNAMVTPQATASATPVIKSLQASLKKNPADFNNWIGLGIAQKEAGDYQGAVISWTYASKLAPSDYISLGNLGNLYAYFIKDNAMAENFYKQAIAKGPLQANLYTQLAEVYVNIFKDTAKAKAIVEQGLIKLPNDANLLQLKASLN